MTLLCGTGRGLEVTRSEIAAFPTTSSLLVSLVFSYKDEKRREKGSCAAKRNSCLRITLTTRVMYNRETVR